MFTTRLPPIRYTDPWAIPFETRRSALLQGSPRVAYYYERPDNSTFRYRAYNMIQVLREVARGTGAAFFSRAEIESLADMIDRFDVLVVCRAPYSDAVDRLICRARAKGRRVLFDVDDLIYDCAFVPLVVNTLDQDLGEDRVWDTFFAYSARIGATLALCDGAITTNEFLAARLADWTGRPVAVIPNFMNREQLELSSRIYRRKVDSRFARDRDVTLGYFSGTPTHNKDLLVAADALAALMRRNKRVRLRIVGFMEVKGALRELRERIESIPLQDFMNLQRLIGEVEINLIPLQDNAFTQSKSELKYFEAAVVGTLSIASPVHTYAAAIHDGVNGFLARSFEWETKLEFALEQMSDYPRLAACAHDHCQTQYGWSRQLPAIEKALFA